MKIKKYVICIVMVQIIFFSNAVQAVTIDDQGETLKGVKNVEVVVEITELWGRKLEVSKSIIQTDIESILKLAGINIVNKSAEAVVSVDIFPRYVPGRSFWAFNIDVVVYQSATLRNSPRHYMLPTWVRTARGTSGEASAGKNLENAIRNLIEFFINDYLTVNQKKAN